MCDYLELADLISDPDTVKRKKYTQDSNACERGRTDDLPDEDDADDDEDGNHDEDTRDLREVL